MADPDYFISCSECGIFFGVPLSFNRWCREDARRTFYCPRGHSQHYSNTENDITKMRRERDRLKQETARLEDLARQSREAAARAREAAEAERHRARGYKGAATRLKNRIRAGVCPCCNRTFQDLARHIASKHPGRGLDNVVELGQDPSAS